MGVITLPWSMEQDRQNQIKANSVHVDDNFNTLLNAVNGKLEADGSIVPTADLPMGSHKITQLATPTASADAATKGYVDSALLSKSDLVSPVFTGSPQAPTATNNQWDGQIATTGFVKNVLNAMFPVGAIYFDTTNSGVCPLQAFFGTWTLVATDRALWGGNGYNGNTTIAAGLPDIGGYVQAARRGTDQTSSGALYWGGSASAKAGDSGGNVSWSDSLTFWADRYNSVYGSSTTVQPPAYRVNVWRRTA